tara:strand:+ start:1229 stop:1873 length:645 start_codon:yes stop_codon:yes gene_type:complete
MKNVTLDPVLNHEETIIILHGMNQSQEDIIYIANKIRKFKKNIKFLILIAEKMNITWPDGKQDNCISWYNYFTRYDNLSKHDIIDFSKFESNSNKIVEIINEETKKISPKMISLIGISQGGTVCINLALKLEFSIKSIICIDTIFLHTYYNYSVFNRQKFYILQSKKDNIYNLTFQNYCYSLLNSYGHFVKKYIRNKFHCEDTESIIRFILKII